MKLVTENSVERAIINLLREEGTLTTHIDNTSVSSSRNDSVASLVDGSN